MAGTATLRGGPAVCSSACAACRQLDARQKMGSMPRGACGRMFSTIVTTRQWCARLSLTKISRGSHLCHDASAGGVSVAERPMVRSVSNCWDIPIAFPGAISGVLNKPAVVLKSQRRQSSSSHPNRPATITVDSTVRRGAGRRRQGFFNSLHGCSNVVVEE